MRKTTKFEDNQTQKQIALLKDSDVFEHAEAGGLCLISDYKTRKKFWRASQKVIKYPDNIRNLFGPIRRSALAYFELNDIEWWRQSEEHYFPNGHVLSSQIHCVNHLFAIRADQDAVRRIIQAILPEITEILPSPM